MTDRQKFTHDEIARRLQEFGRSDDLLLTPARMLEHSGNWVAASGGNVVAVGKDLTDVTSRLRIARIPLATVALRFIEEGGQAAAWPR